MADNQEKTITIKNALDLNIVGENIHDIAEFTIEKYEFRNDTTLSADAREEAIKKIRDALWKRIEEMRARRQEWLRQMFATAESALEDCVDGS